MTRRTGFTIIELLVALALTMFIMSILSEAFFAGVKVFRDFKALGDLTGRLRTASRILLDDLQTPHFESGHKPLGDPKFWDITQPGGGPPHMGFFRIGQQAVSTKEGSSTAPFSFHDMDGLPSYMNAGGTTTSAGAPGNCWLHFAINKSSVGNVRQAYYRSYPPSSSALLTGLQGDSRYQDYVSGTSPTETYSTFNSQWAEVAWFMQQSGTTIPNTTTNLFTLYRRQLVAFPPGLTPPTTVANPTTTPTNYETVSCESDPVSGNLHFNTPGDLTQPARRFSMAGYSSTATPIGLTAGLPPTAALPLPGGTMGDNAYSGLFPATTATFYPILSGGQETNDVVLTDVVSFDVRILVPGNTDFQDLFDPSIWATNANAFDPSTGTSAPSGCYTYTTGTSTFYSPFNPNFAFIAKDTPSTSVPPTATKWPDPTGPLVFDTWTSDTDIGGIYTDYNVSWNTLTNGGSPHTATSLTPASAPLQTPILAIKVSIRIWDPKSEQTRQVSIITPFTQ